MRKTVTLTASSLLALVAATACGGPPTSAGASGPSAAPSTAASGPGRASVPASPAASAPAGPVRSSATAVPPPGGGGHSPGDDIRHRDWKQETLTVRLCGVDATIRFHDGAAQARSAQHGTVHLSIDPGTSAPVYGDLDGDGADEAAVPVDCDNGGGMAPGVWEYGAVLVKSAGGRLTSIGTVVPQATNDTDQRAIPMAVKGIAPRTVTVAENWYHGTDADCCPSGTATTVWSLTGDRLVPGTPVRG